MEYILSFEEMKTRSPLKLVTISLKTAYFKRTFVISSFEFAVLSKPRSQKRIIMTRTANENLAVNTRKYRRKLVLPSKLASRQATPWATDHSPTCSLSLSFLAWGQVG